MAENALPFTDFRYSDSVDPVDRIFNRFILQIAVVLWETILTILDSIETGSPVESEIMRVVSPSTREITEVTRMRCLYSLHTLNENPYVQHLKT